MAGNGDLGDDCENGDLGTRRQGAFSSRQNSLAGGQHGGDDTVKLAAVNDGCDLGTPGK